MYLMINSLNIDKSDNFFLLKADNEHFKYHFTATQHSNANGMSTEPLFVLEIIKEKCLLSDNDN